MEHPVGTPLHTICLACDSPRGQDTYVKGLTQGHHTSSATRWRAAAHSIGAPSLRQSLYERQPGDIWGPSPGSSAHVPVHLGPLMNYGGREHARQSTRNHCPQARWMEVWSPRVVAIALPIWLQCMIWSVRASGRYGRHANRKEHIQHPMHRDKCEEGYLIPKP